MNTTSSGAVKETCEALEDDAMSNNERRRVSKELHEAVAPMDKT
ncbi:hypothetical protein [uncultured Desulfuromusa sp.]|nr:hypothetical protein [uncultured Desulfuromusa sp.]